MLSENRLYRIKELARLVADEREPARFIILLRELNDLIEQSRILAKKPAPVIPITAKSATPRSG